MAGVERPDTNRMTPVRATPRTLVMLSVCLLAVGLWQIGEGSWIYAKARLAQYLLQRAWSRTLAGETDVAPWPWADTYPVARLRVPSMRVDLIVLNGSYGRTLAFGPGYAEASAYPGSAGTTIVTGHRDTHFHFLKRLKRQDEIVIETVLGTAERYRVHSTGIVDARIASITLAEGKDQLALVTCYPFDTVLTGGPLRYVVMALRVPSALLVPPIGQAVENRQDEENQCGGQNLKWEQAFRRLPGRWTDWFWVAAGED
jgi:sortase A